MLEQPGREPVTGAVGESQLPRLGPPGHPVRGQGDMQEDEQPTRGDLRRLRRLGRYLVGRPLSVWCFEFQDARGELTCYTDSDCECSVGNCEEKRKREDETRRDPLDSREK